MLRKTIVFGLLCGLVCSAACAESLWREKGRSIAADRKARAVGDIVTVIVSETATSTLKAATDTQKSSDLEGGPGVGPIFKNIKEFAFSGKQSTTAEGTTARSASLLAKITATVTKVLPNGNLVIEGTREVATNKERQVLKLTGVIRPEDVSPDNTILSTYLADANITLYGKGIIAERQREGIVTRIINWLF